MQLFRVLLLFAIGSGLFAQNHADSAQSRILFPHFVNGGNPADYFRTSMEFFNPSSEDVDLRVSFRNDSGGPLSLAMNGIVNSEFLLAIPAFGLRELVATETPLQITSGYVVAVASYPIQAVCTFKRIQSGKTVAVVTADPSLPAVRYNQLANRDLGVAIVNPIDEATEYRIDLLDQDGFNLDNTLLALGPRGHTAFNVGNLFPSLSANYKGLIVIRASRPQDRFVAWALFDDGSRVNSPLPSGRVARPVALYERVHAVYDAVYRQAKEDLGDDPVDFQIQYTSDLNATGSSDGKVRITLPLLELLGDSPDELAHVIGHELAHVAQFRNNGTLYDNNWEWDADIVGAIWAIGAGYSPYAMSGVLARLAMVTGTADLRNAAQAEYDAMTLQDAHGSLNTRTTVAFTNLQKVCSTPGVDEICAEIKAINRPHLPPAAPLGRLGSGIIK